MIVLNEFYSLDCRYYDKKFITLDELLDDIASSGMDPNYETFTYDSTTLL